MIREYIYLEKVNQTTELFRSTCLAQDTALLSVLPLHLKNCGKKTQADHIAEQLLFALSKTNSGQKSSPKTLKICRIWLREIISYLLIECDESDQTFRYLKRIILLQKEIREILLLPFCAKKELEYLKTEPPEPFCELDIAIFKLAKTHDQTAFAEEVQRKFWSNLNNKTSI